ncbi:ISAzo13 family transposase [Mesorhizobium sp.]|uniref:ISAzo13 family transposase n=1 Tax=Mesorhizobium sp. TaxID=1871066 RepID=UPI0034142601
MERRIRRPGGGSKPKIEAEPGLLGALEDLVQSATRGDPEAALLWVSRSQRHLATALADRGFTASWPVAVQLGFSLQANRKTLEGASHPDRDAPIRAHQSEDQAVPDDRATRHLGRYEEKGTGRRFQKRRARATAQRRSRAGTRPRVQDTPTRQGCALWRLRHRGQLGWVNVGIDHDTAAFAVESIRRWWHALGKSRYLGSPSLLITADCGGSNGGSCPLVETRASCLRAANETGLSITVAHHPPGTSKWNRIEHRLFAFTTQNWRGKPLISHEVIVQLIGATTTDKGLDVQCCLDEKRVSQGDQGRRRRNGRHQPQA